MSSVIGAVVFAAFAIGYLLAVSRHGERQEQKAQNGGPEDKASSKKENLTLWQRALHTYFSHYHRNRNERRHHRNPNITWSIRTFWAVFLYTGITSALLVVSYLSLGIARDSERRQLRAYVSLAGKGADNFGSALPVSVAFYAKNSGQTPAFDATFKGWVGIASYPLPARTEIIMAATADISKVVLFPAIEFDGTKNSGLLTTNDIAAITDGRTIRLYIIEIVTYRDAFEKWHWTRMCASIGGQALARVIQERNAAGGGNVTGNIFEYCDRYNDTDDLQ